MPGVQRQERRDRIVCVWTEPHHLSGIGEFVIVRINYEHEGLVACAARHGSPQACDDFTDTLPDHLPLSQAISRVRGDQAGDKVALKRSKRRRRPLHCLQLR